MAGNYYFICCTSWCSCFSASLGTQHSEPCCYVMIFDYCYSSTPHPPRVRSTGYFFRDFQPCRTWSGNCCGISAVWMSSLTHPSRHYAYLAPPSSHFSDSTFAHSLGPLLNYEWVFFIFQVWFLLIDAADQDFWMTWLVSSYSMRSAAAGSEWIFDWEQANASAAVTYCFCCLGSVVLASMKQLTAWGFVRLPVMLRGWWTCLISSFVGLWKWQGGRFQIETGSSYQLYSTYFHFVYFDLVSWWWFRHLLDLASQIPFVIHYSNSNSLSKLLGLMDERIDYVPITSYLLSCQIAFFGYCWYICKSSFFASSVPTAPSLTSSAATDDLMLALASSLCSMNSLFIMNSDSLTQQLASFFYYWFDSWIGRCDRLIPLDSICSIFLKNNADMDLIQV